MLKHKFNIKLFTILRLYKAAFNENNKRLKKFEELFV